MTKPTKKLYPHRPGTKVFIRTVTHYMTGEIVDIGRDWISLRAAAWIADTGRFSDALTTGLAKTAEVEPIPAACEPYVVARGAIVDSMVWPHPLPRVQQ